MVQEISRHKQIDKQTDKETAKALRMKNWKSLRSVKNQEGSDAYHKYLYEKKSLKGEHKR